MDEFRKKYEKELKEIKELGKTDRKAAHAKFVELLKKEGIECPKKPGDFKKCPPPHHHRKGPPPCRKGDKKGPRCDKAPVCPPAPAAPAPEK